MFDIIGHIFDVVIAIPCLNMLIFFHQWVGDLGLLLLLFAVAFQALSWPLAVHGMRAQKHMERALKTMQPEVDELKKHYANNRQAFNVELRKLYKQHNINPLGGCLSIIVPIVCLLALWSVLSTMLVNDAGHMQPGTVNNLLYAFVPHLQQAVDTNLYWFSGLNNYILDLTTAEPGALHILAILAGALTFVQVKMILPGNVSQQKQSLSNMLTSVIVVVVTIASFWVLPAGLAFFFIVVTLITIVQQLYVNGWRWSAQTPEIALAGANNIPLGQEVAGNNVIFGENVQDDTKRN